jgi:hypothetical protein
VEGKKAGHPIPLATLSLAGTGNTIPVPYTLPFDAEIDDQSWSRFSCHTPSVQTKQSSVLQITESGS